MTRSDFLKNVLTPVIGFGIGGALWGWEVFLGETRGSPLGTPFAYVFGALFLGILGSGSIAVSFEALREGGFLRSWKKILQVISFGTLAWLIAFNLPRIWEYYLWLFGWFVRIIPETIGMSTSMIQGSIALEPFLAVTELWLEFLLVGLIVAGVYAFLLKRQLKKPLIYGAVGFVLASIISPILGNILGNLFNSLFVSYLVTFSLIGIIFGFALVLGLRNDAEVQT